MFQYRTVLIVGAGASKEAGLPTGEELKERIAAKLDFRFEYQDIHRQVSGDPKITDALIRHVQDTHKVNPYFRAGHRIVNAMPMAMSIDSFIDAQANKEIEVCGKLAIVQSILEAERQSRLYFDKTRADSTVDYHALSDTWFNSFIRLLTEDCRKEHLSDRFSNIIIVTFNYDRCIEHYLFYALQTYYGIDGKESANLLNNLKIYHPYGKVGSLPWQYQDHSTEFGEECQADKLLSLSKQIKTFTEQTTDQTELSQIHDAIQSANILIFLGFAFHRQNMELIKPSVQTEAKSVFATARGISNSDVDVIEEQIHDLTATKAQHMKVFVRIDCGCAQLFQEIWRSFALA